MTWNLLCKIKFCEHRFQEDFEAIEVYVLYYTGMMQHCAHQDFRLVSGQNTDKLTIIFIFKIKIQFTCEHSHTDKIAIDKGWL